MLVWCSVTPSELGLILLVMLWNGLVVNALASVFQVRPAELSHTKHTRILIPAMGLFFPVYGGGWGERRKPSRCSC